MNKSRLILAVAAAVGLMGLEIPAALAQSAFQLEDGTPIELRLARRLSSADAQVDERVNFEVLEDVVVKGALVIPKGSVALGTITEAQSKRRMGRGGKLGVELDSVRLADGEKCAISATKNEKGGGHVGAMTTGMVASALVVAPVVAPLFLLMHGKDITMPKGTPITAYVAGTMNLDATKFSASAAAEAQAVEVLPAPTFAN
jgi:hypothetical protein